MQDNRTDDAAIAARRANSVPAVTNVHGVGESHALSVELQPVQLAWLADEIDTLCRSIEDELARARARHDQRSAGDQQRRSTETREAEAEVDRRTYQLQLLAMIRDQLPIGGDAVASAVANPWETGGEDPARVSDGVAGPVAVVGPARAMLVLIRGAARNVADALGEALRGPEHHTERRIEHSGALHWPEWQRLTPPVAARLHAQAAAAEAFTATYADAVLQQSYSFDPEHHPTYPDELW